MSASGLPKEGRSGGVGERLGGWWRGLLGCGKGDGGGAADDSEELWSCSGAGGRSVREKDFLCFPLRPGDLARRVRFDEVCVRRVARLFCSLIG